MNTKFKLLLLEKEISELAKTFRNDWKEELCESEDIEEFGLNEYLGGRADAYEDCLGIIRKCIHSNSIQRYGFYSMK
jgi:hypothetical protein